MEKYRVCILVYLFTVSSLSSLSSNFKDNFLSWKGRDQFTFDKIIMQNVYFTQMLLAVSFMSASWTIPGQRETPLNYRGSPAADVAQACPFIGIDRDGEHM